LLIDEAVFELEHLQSGRKAIVAAWFLLSLQPFGTATKLLGTPQQNRVPLMFTGVFHPVIQQQHVGLIEARDVVNSLTKANSKL